MHDKHVDECNGNDCRTRFTNSIFFGSGKHHCRQCGKIFCGKCSDRVMPVPCYTSCNDYTPKRVCITCYNHTHGK